MMYTEIWQRSVFVEPAAKLTDKYQAGLLQCDVGGGRNAEHCVDYLRSDD